MFVLKASVWLKALKEFCPDIANATQAAWLNKTSDAKFVRPGKVEFAAVPSASIDYAVMEHTQDAAMVTVNIGWSDIGSWSSLAEVSTQDVQGNALRGDVYIAETANTYVRAETRTKSGGSGARPQHPSADLQVCAHNAADLGRVGVHALRVGGHLPCRVVERCCVRVAAAEKAVRTPCS